jgi:hydrogenase expression/formation protein HypC
VGQYVIVHAGFALNVLDEAEAQETLDLFRQMGMMEESALGD